MNGILLRKEIARSAPFFALLALGLVVFGVLLMMVFPSFQDQYQSLLKAVPPFFRPLVQERMGLNAFESFLTTGYTHPFVLGLMAAWSVAKGAQAVAGEIEGGTLGWMLAYPIGRVRFLLTKAFVLVAGCFILAFLLSSTFWLVGTRLGLTQLPYSVFAMAAANSGLLYASIGAVTLLASVLSSERSKPMLVGGGLFLGSFLLKYIALLWKPLTPFLWWSLFAYDEPKLILTKHRLPTHDITVLALVLLVALAAAVHFFRRRELTI